MPEIRVAGVGDARHLAELAEATFRDTYAEVNTPQNMDLHCKAHYGAALQRAEMLDPAITTLVCEHDGVLVGYLQLRRGEDSALEAGQRALEIQRLYVTKAWHGRGVAQDLMAAAIRRAEEKGAGRIWLGVWERNSRAVAFYTKCGFEAVGEQVFLLGTDPQRDLVMERRVTIRVDG